MWPERSVIGWDVGGAHLKACLLVGGRVRDVAQWPCALWQGLEQLDAGLTPVSEGWFVVNVRDAAWLTNDAFGLRCVFEASPRVGDSVYQSPFSFNSDSMSSVTQAGLRKARS